MRNKKLTTKVLDRMGLVLLLYLYVIKAMGESVTFSVSAPDTLEYGKMVKVIYKLHTNEYRNVEFPRFSNFNMYRYSYPQYESYSNKTKFRDVEWSMEVIPYKSGFQALPTMSVEINGERIQSKEKNVFVKGRGSQQDERMLKALQKFWNTQDNIYTPEYKPKSKIQMHLSELNVAQDILVKMGQAKDNIWLSEKYSNDEIVVFSDDWNQCFVITAKENYNKYLGNPILAYSLESAFINHDMIVKYYSEEVKALIVAQHGNNEPAIQQGVTQHESVKPLLGEMAWGPFEPYNNLLPLLKNQKKPFSNPATVALAQIMGYYKYPQKGSGSHYYQISPEEVIGKDFGSLMFDWKTIKDKYDESAPQNLAAELVAANSYALETEWPDDNSSRCTNMRNFKSALVKFFGYSNSCMFLDNISNNITASMLYKELDAGRPVLCQGLSHYFVCDGYDGNFLHFNMGLGGLINGYYRIMLSSDSSISMPIIESMLVNIHPSTNGEFTKELTLTKPGMLANSLSEKEIREVTHLKITGKMNGEDMKIIRRMSGAIEFDNNDSNSGSLKYLDLEDAIFETDKDHPYLSKDASGYTYTTTNYTILNGVTIDEETTVKNMNEVTHEQWESMRKKRIFKGKGYRIKEDEHSKYHVDFSMKKGIVTPFLFENCDNLEEIKLPLDTKSIEDGAFANCNSLVIIVLPPKVKSITESAFMLCYNLEHVYYTSNYPPVENKSTHAHLSIGRDEYAKGILTGIFAGNNKATCKGLIKKL